MKTQSQYLEGAVIVGYLAGIFLLRWASSRKLRSLSQYALGYSPGQASAGFPWFVLVGTLVAAEFGGGSIVGNCGDAMRHGITFTATCLLLQLPTLLIAYCAVPRLQGLLGAGPHAQVPSYLSTGDLLGHFFGKPAQVITGLATVLIALCYVAIQVGVITWLLRYYLGFSHALGVSLACGLVLLYTTTGGVRVITLTDVVHFILFTLSIFLVALSALRALSLSSSNWMQAWADFASQIPSSHLSWRPHDMPVADLLALAAISLIPYMEPILVQRMLMAGHSGSLQPALKVSAAVQCALHLLIGFVGFVALVQFPQVQGHYAFIQVVSTYVPSGLQGIIVAGILAAIMAKADAYLNVSGLGVIRDLILPLRRTPIRDDRQVFLARAASWAVALGGLALALTSQRILSLGMAACACWAPVVVVPLWAGLLGYRASGRTFLVAVGAGQAVFWLWSWHFDNGPGGMIAIIPAMVANAAAFALARRWDGPASPAQSPLQATPLPQAAFSASTANPSAYHFSHAQEPAVYE